MYTKKACSAGHVISCKTQGNAEQIFSHGVFSFFFSIQVKMNARSPNERSFFFTEHYCSQFSVDSAPHWAVLNSLRSPEYKPNLQRLLPAPLLGAVGVDLVQPDDDLREGRPAHGLRVPAFLDQPAQDPGKKKSCQIIDAVCYSAFCERHDTELNVFLGVTECGTQEDKVSMKWKDPSFSLFQNSRFEVWGIALELALQWWPRPLEPDWVSWILWRFHYSFDHLMLTPTKNEWL